MEFKSGKFISYTDHHSGWFQFWRFGKGVEVWFGNKYFIFRWGSK